MCMFLSINIFIKYVILFFKEKPWTTVALHFQFHAVKFFIVFLFGGLNEGGEVVKEYFYSLPPPLNFAKKKKKMGGGGEETKHKLEIAGLLNL